MERADFVHLVRLSEHASADNSMRYRRGVAVFAALGYLWVVACLALAVGLLAWIAASFAHGGGFSIGRGWLLLFALALLWTTVCALCVRFEEPEGAEITAEDAPMLFDALERIRKKIHGPPVHRVFLDGEFNASIRQLPRFGLFGGAVNYLNIGLPLLMALDRRRLLSVLAHEYGHLRGNHGKLSAWIYRTRLSWLKLDASLQRNEGLMAFASQAFFRWYFPRFAAKTFALARQDEYEADRVAARLLGTRVVGAALAEIEVKSAWYADRFWPLHWSQALHTPQAAGPFSAMRERLRSPVDEDFARVALRAALRNVSDIDDTHPVLRDRLEALDEKPRQPSWSQKSALAMLAEPERWIAHFDEEWCRAHGQDWKEHHAHLSRLRERCEGLAVTAGSNSADEMVEWADCARRLDADADVRGRYERALQITANHPGALRGLAQMLPITERPARLQVLERLHESSMASRWWAAKTAVGLLEDPDGGGHDDLALKLWREREKDAEAAEQRAWEEITGTPHFSHITRHDLSEFELGELKADLLRCSAVASAWVVRKNLREFPWRRAYVVFLDLPHIGDEERWHLCRQLEQTLSLPGVALVLWAGHSPTLAEIERKAFGAVWARQVQPEPGDRS